MSILFTKEQIVVREQAQKMAYAVNAPTIVFSDGLVVPAWQHKPKHPGAVLMDEDDRDIMLEHHQHRYQINYYVPAIWFIEQVKK